MGSRFKSVLIVEDEPAIRDALKLIVEQEGYQVYTAGNGKEALQIASREPPDLIVTDLAMPGMNGLDLARAVRASAGLRSLPVLAVSASVSVICCDRLAMFSITVAAFCVKPCETWSRRLAIIC